MKLRPLQNNTPIKEGNPMKPIAFLSLFAAVFLVSCSATRYGATVYDDVYYSPGDPVVHVKEVVVNKQLEQDEPVYYNDEETYADPEYETPYMETERYTDDEGQSVSNYYFYGDYYDYSYSSRIRRFHRPMGYSYYHDYYTNMYWYNYDPHYWGTSIYIGYGHYPGSFYGHYGWGWPRRSHWYNPYYMYGMGYPHYYHGWYSSYWTGYRHGYWDGHYGYPYYGGWYKNSRDENSYYYGPRTGFAGNTGGGGVTGSGRPGTFGQKYEEAIAAQNQGREADRISRGSRPPTSEEGRAAGTTPASGTRPSLQETDRTGSRETSTLREGQRPTATPAEGRQVYERPSSDRSDEGARTVAPNQRSYQYNRESSRQAPAYERPDAQRQQAQPAQRQPQPYSSPRYTKPKTSEEFTSPAYRSPRETTQPAESAAPRRQEATPQQRAPQPQTTPQRQQPTQPRYSPPSRPSDSRQTAPPSRNVTPSRSPSSTPGYSPPRSSSPPPSRSTSPGISSPSRSSSPPPSRSSSPSISSPSRSSGSSAPSRGSSSGSSRSSGRGGR